jgi:hypothetical protein
MTLYFIRSTLLVVLLYLVNTITPALGKGCKPKDSTQFKSEKVSRTDSIVLNGNLKQVFPLFGAFEERKWDPDWHPMLVYMDRDTIEEGTTFKTASHGYGEPEYIWRINKYEPQTGVIQYLVMCPNRYWTITVKCKELAHSKTLARVTYTFVGLNQMGNHLNKHFLDRLYEHHHLKDWEQAINAFLSKEDSVKNN